MKSTLLLSMVLVCLALATHVKGQIVINEVLLDGANDVIELKNLGTNTVDVSSWWICYQPDYHQISDLTVSGSTTMAPGALMTLSGAALDLNAGQEDVGLYQFNGFSNAANMVDFVQYGATGDIGRTNVAETKGIWTLTEAVATPAAGQSIQFDGSGNGAAHWISGGTATLGADNVNAVCEAGSIRLPGGHVAATICAGDGRLDPLLITVTGASDADYGFFVTDDQGDILSFSTNTTIDLDGAPVGTCRVYGFSSLGVITNNALGTSVSNVSAVCCADLSDEWVEITRTGPVEAGMVMHEAGLTNLTICLDAIADPIPMVRMGETTNASYAYVVTDDGDTVLGFPAGDIVDLNGATPGVCRIYGISYNGSLDTTVGGAITAVTASGCLDFSVNYLRVIRRPVASGCVTNSSLGSVSVNSARDTVQLSLSTAYGPTYNLESTDRLVPANWLPVTNGITGNGEIQELMVPILGNVTSQFYRLSVAVSKIGQTAEFITRFHDVVGTCTIVDADTIEITNFSYDATGVNVQVIVSPNANFDPYTSISDNLLMNTSYNHVTLTYDHAVPLEEINYISIWCIPFEVSFGDGQFD